MPKIQKMARRVVGGALYVLSVFLFFEISARGFLAADFVFDAVVGAREEDSSERLAWIKRHAAQGKFANLYAFDTYDSLRGWALMPNVRNMTVFGDRILNTNSKGLRGNLEFSYLRHPGEKRIVVLGDSYTFGDEVSDDETFTYKLSRLLPDTEVLNLGVHGYGHDQMLLYLKQEGIKYQPDVVLIGFVWFDMYRNLRSFISFAKPQYVLRGSDLQLKNVPVPNPQTVLDREVYRSKALDLGVMLLSRLRAKLGLDRKRAETITIALFDELVKVTRSIGAVPVFVYFPVLDEIANRHPGMTANERFLLSYCERRQVSCLFLRDRFLQEQHEGAQYNIRGHWHADAHAAAARRIGEYLEANDLLGRSRRIRGAVPEGPIAIR